MRLCLRGSLAKRTVSILIILRKETSWGSGLPRGSAPGAVPACAHSGSRLSRHEDSLEYRGWGYTAVKVEKEHIEVRQPEGGQQPLLPAQTGRPAGFTSATVPPPNLPARRWTQNSDNEEIKLLSAPYIHHESPE